MGFFDKQYARLRKKKYYKGPSRGEFYWFDPATDSYYTWTPRGGHTNKKYRGESNTLKESDKDEIKEGAKKTDLLVGTLKDNKVTIALAFLGFVGICVLAIWYGLPVAVIFIYLAAAQAIPLVKEIFRDILTTYYQSKKDPSSHDSIVLATVVNIAVMAAGAIIAIIIVAPLLPALMPFSIPAVLALGALVSTGITGATIAYYAFKLTASAISYFFDEGHVIHAFTYGGRGKFLDKQSKKPEDIELHKVEDQKNKNKENPKDDNDEKDNLDHRPVQHNNNKMSSPPQFQPPQYQQQHQLQQSSAASSPGPKGGGNPSNRGMFGQTSGPSRNGYRQVQQQGNDEVKWSNFGGGGGHYYDGGGDDYDDGGYSNGNSNGASY